MADEKTLKKFFDIFGTLGKCKLGQEQQDQIDAAIKGLDKQNFIEILMNTDERRNKLGGLLLMSKYSQA